MEQCKIVNMYDLNETIAKEYMETAEYPWELLDGLSHYIKRLGATLDPEKYEKRGEDVWVAKNAKVAPTAFLGSPLIIDEEADSLLYSAGLRISELLDLKPHDINVSR